jgi:ADP-ribose pyrophosphatase
VKLKLVKRTTVFEGRVFDIIVDDVEYPSGNTTVREVARHAGGAVVVPVLDDGRVVLIRQHRYPLDEVIWELPAGKLDRGEDPLACAKRELEEETGYAASEWKLLNSIFTTPGFCDEVLHIYLARGLRQTPGGRRPEEGEESMTVHEVPFTEAVRMVSAMEIRDGKSICGILQAAPLLGPEPPSVPAGEGKRLYRTVLEKCVRPECGGRPVELSYYDRNNWATSEMQCDTCRTRFTMKLEI